MRLAYLVVFLFWNGEWNRAVQLEAGSRKRKTENTFSVVCYVLHYSGRR